MSGPASLVVASPRSIADLLALDYPKASWLITGHGFQAARQLAQAWKRERVDRVVLFPTSFSSRWAGLWSGARERIGHGPRPSGRREWEAAFGLTRVVPRVARGERHLEEEYLDLARALGAETMPSRTLSLSERASSTAQAWLHDAGEALVLAPGARFGPAKRWPAKRYAEVARSWTKGSVVLVGGEEDKDDVHAVARSLEKTPINLAGKTSLPELAAVLARAAAVVSNDSGVAHLAAAVGAPSVTVFGSTDPRWTAPRGERSRVIWERVSCAPCFRRRCPYVDAYACLRVVQAGRVVEALPR